MTLQEIITDMLLAQGSAKEEQDIHRAFGMLQMANVLAVLRLQRLNDEHVAAAIADELGREEDEQEYLSHRYNSRFGD